MNKKHIALILIAFFFMPISYFITNTNSQEEPYIIDGDSVYYTGNWGTLIVYPHTSHNLKNHIQYCNITITKPTNNYDVAFRFDFEINIAQSDIWIKKPMPQIIRIPNYETVEMNYTLNDVINFQVITQPFYVDYGDLDSTHFASVSILNNTGYCNITIGLDSYNQLDNDSYKCFFNTNVATSYNENTIYVDEYVSIKDKLQHEIVNNKHYFYIKNVTLQENKQYQFKIKYNTDIGVTGKWDLIVKYTDESIQYALDNDRYILLCPWFDSDFIYRKKCNVDDSVNDFTIKLEVDEDGTDGDVDCDGHCQADFDDLRFTDVDGNELDYWIEKILSGVAYVWIELPSDIETDNAIYMYYGDGSATTTGDGDNTFLWFNDCLSTTGWEGDTAQISIDSGYLKFTYSVGGTYYFIYEDDTGVQFPLQFQRRFYFDSSGSNYAQAIHMITNETDTDGNDWDITQSFEYTNNNYKAYYRNLAFNQDTSHSVTTAAPSSSTFYVYNVKCGSDDNNLYTYWYNDDYSEKTSSTENDLYDMSNFENLKFAVRFKSRNIWVDYFFIRLYADTEPSWLSFGSEETYSASPPVVSNESPTNQSVNISVQSDFSCLINHTYGNSFNYTIECSNGESTSENGVYNNTYTLTLSTLDKLTNYTIWVNCTDDLGESSAYWFWFITVPNAKPVVSNESPTNQSVNVSRDSDFSCYISDLDNDSMNYTIECSNGESTNANGVYNSTIHLTLSQLEYLHNYTILVNVTDGNTKAYYVFWFITVNYSESQKEWFSIGDEFKTHIPILIFIIALVFSIISEVTSNPLHCTLATLLWYILAILVTAMYQDSMDMYIGIVVIALMLIGIYYSFKTYFNVSR